MSKKKKIIVITILSILALMFIGYNLFFNENNEAVALSRYGSRGSEVKTIQTKLKRWGYYSGSVDGIYGSQTVAAVKKFQKKNGLTVDCYGNK